MAVTHELENGFAHSMGVERQNSVVPHVGVVDPDPRRAQITERLLKQRGYRVIVDYPHTNALQLLDAYKLDCLVLGAGTKPSETIINEVRKVREFYSLPILVLDIGGNPERAAQILEGGADDCLYKPHNREIPARVGALIRRKRYTLEDRKSTIFKNGELTINFAQHLVLLQGREINLTPTEYKLLVHLAKNLGRVVSHEDIILAVWGHGHEGAWYLLKCNINRLRTRLGNPPGTYGSRRESGKFKYLTTHFRVGYMMPNLNQTKVNGTITMNPAPILPRTK